MRKILDFNFSAGGWRGNSEPRERRRKQNQPLMHNNVMHNMAPLRQSAPLRHSIELHWDPNKIVTSYCHNPTALCPHALGTIFSLAKWGPHFDQSGDLMGTSRNWDPKGVFFLRKKTRSAKQVQIFENENTKSTVTDKLRICFF